MREREVARRFALPQDYGPSKCLLSLNQLRKVFSFHSAAHRGELPRASLPVRVSFAMQSAYFSYPRDFVGTTRQARRRLAVRGHADFRATLGKAPTESQPNLRNPAERRAASEVRSRLRFEVTSRSHLAERRIVF